MYSKTRTFSHIYVEEAALEHPRARRILARLPRSQVVRVDHYKNVFNRPRQVFWRQKTGPKLVLALRRDNFLYGGNEFLQANLSPNFRYNTTVLNCPYDCHYCYLQGMFPGAHLVVFVNLEDFFMAAETACRTRPDPANPVPLAISYDSDLLALEGLLGFVREWTDWARGQPDILLEVRTKSAPQRFLREVEPTDAVRIAWTLSPEPICSRYESGAPALKLRIEALRRAVEQGWRVALCLDPILRVPDWRNLYRDFLGLLEEQLPWTAIERVEIGVFRMNAGYFKAMQKRPDTDLLQYPYEHASKAVSYHKEEREELIHHISLYLPETLPKQHLFIWT